MVAVPPLRFRLRNTSYRGLRFGFNGKTGGAYLGYAPIVALLVIGILCVLMIWFVFRTWSRDRVSAWLFIPSLLYVSYTAAMTAAIVVLN